MTFYEMKDAKLVTYTKCPDWLMYTDLRPAARGAYLALWSHYDPKNGDLVVHPSIKRIAWLANIGPTCAREAIRELQDAGLVLVKGRKDNGGGPNEFLLYEPSAAEIRALVGRRKQKFLTSDDTKIQRSDQASPESEVPPSESEVPPFGIRCRIRTNEQDPGTRPRNETQERDPEAPPPAGPQTKPGSQRPLRGLETNGFPAPVSTSNDHSAGTDFASLRARLERHV